MVSFKLVGTLLAVTCLLASTQAATTRKPASKERVTALYVKDGNNGELRFLGSNAQINEFINQKQEMLEQLRPTSTGTGTGSAVTPIIINTATAGATATGTGTGTLTSPTTGTTGTATTGTGGGNNFIPASPIGDLLPQIIAQATLTRGRPGGAGNRRRVVNKRRRNNRRRGGARKGNRKNKRPQVYVVKPRN